MAYTGSNLTEPTPATKRLLEEMRLSFPELLREQKDLMRRLNEVNARVGAHAAMFQAYGIEIPREAGPTTTGSTIVPLISGEPVSGRSHRGKIAGHISEALKSGPMTTPQLREEIVRRFGVRYGISSLYRVLKLPENSKLFKVTGGRWELR